jgi:4-hydroxybenzoate polyprenyltransferase
MLPAALDALAWSSLWLALAASALAAAASRALGVTPAPAVLGLAFGGTVVVYVIDRLRDLARDRVSAPERAAFVERHRRALLVLAGLGGGLAAGSALALRPRAVCLALVVGALGLLHRRLKRWFLVKPAYLTFAWTAVPVGLPAAHDPAAQHVGFAAGVVGASVLANVALSNLRDGEGVAGRIGRRRTLAVAGGLAAAGLGAALLGPAPARPLAALPLVMGAAVLGFRPSERYGALVVDGALLAGALAALALGAL